MTNKLFKTYYNRLLKSETTYFIKSGSGAGGGSGGFDPVTKEVFAGLSDLFTLSQELFHAYQSDLGTILIRLMVGAVFLSEGIQKFLFPAIRGTGRFEKIGLPAPEFLGPFVGSFEIVCGALILAGLLTRLASIPLITIMLVAIATAKADVLMEKGFWEMMHGIGRPPTAPYSLTSSFKRKQDIAARNIHIPANTKACSGSPPKRGLYSSGMVTMLMICGTTMKPLNKPIYTPMRSLGTELDSIT